MHSHSYMPQFGSLSRTHRRTLGGSASKGNFGVCCSLRYNQLATDETFRSFVQMQSDLPHRFELLSSQTSRICPEPWSLCARITMGVIAALSDSRIRYWPVQWTRRPWVMSVYTLNPTLRTNRSPYMLRIRDTCAPNQAFIYIATCTSYNV